jgi:hypothetical protein
VPLGIEMYKIRTLLSTEYNLLKEIAKRKVNQ